MKVRINHTVEVDAEAWANEYGIELSRVREDVRLSMADLMRDHIECVLGLAPEPKTPVADYLDSLLRRRH